MKVVLDANVLVSSLIVKHGKPAAILRQIGEYELLSSEEILAETERVLLPGNCSCSANRVQNVG